MLGVGFGKLLLLIFAILIVWYGYRYVVRVDEIRQKLRRAQEAAAARARGEAPRLDAEDMVKCRICGTYVTAKGATRCGRSDCPW
jgi:uncharacterized protein